MDVPLDLDVLIRILTLLPSVLKGGTELTKSVGDLVDKIRQRAREKPALGEALYDAQVHPDDPDTIATLRQQLKKLLKEEPDLQREIQDLLKTNELHIYVHSVPALSEHPYPLHNLPQPDYVTFVGREKEREWLRKRLSPADRAWILLLTGIGGVGKTALALAIAHEYYRRYSELPPSERFDAIVWVSAKEQVLTPSGPEASGPPSLVSRTLAEVYRAIAQALDREAITRAAPQDQDWEVRKALTAQRTLLILDNLDTMDDAVRAFLRNLPAPTKAIVTSREKLDVADTLVLRGMEREDALALMKAESEPRSLALTSEQEERLYERTAGLPLPIRLSIARLGSGETFEGVMRWLSNATGDLPEYCVGGQVELARKRNPNTYLLLIACSLFDRDAGAAREVLGEITDLPIADRDEGLLLLEHFNLLNRTTNDRFWMLPIVQEYARAQLEKSEFAPTLIDRWLNWALRFSKKWAASLDIRTENSPIVAAEYLNLRQALDWCEKQQYQETFVALVDNLWFYPYLTGLLVEVRRMLNVAREFARRKGNKCIEGRMLRREGILRWEQGDRAGSVELLSQATAITRECQDLEELGLALDRLSDHLIELGNAKEGYSLASEVLEIGEKTGNLQIKVLAAYRLSMAESAQKNLKASLDWLDQAEIWSRELGWQRALAWHAYRRGANMIENGKASDAEPWLLKAMETMTWEEPRLIAYSKSRLAQVYQSLGRQEEAYRTAKEALDLVERVGLYVLRDDLERVLQESSKR